MTHDETQRKERHGASAEGGDGGELQRLVGELLELSRKAPQELSARVARLTVREQAELALRLPPAQRVELLLHAPKPMRIVRALPDADLYLTVREVGPTDAMPVLALASSTQLQHLIDLEAWRGDRFDADRAGAWVALFLEAGEPSARRFLRNADDELLTLLFQDWIRVEQIEYEDGAEKHGHGEGDAGTERGAITPDGYHRYSPSIAEHAPVIRRLLELFSVDQPDRYRHTLWSALGELSSEVEEQALHWRQSRLEEHGFPDRDEALSIYAPPSGLVAEAWAPAGERSDGLDASRLSLMVLPRESSIVTAIESLPGDARERVLFEMLSLANRILVADAADTGDPAAHRAAVAKAAGYLGVALELRGTDRPADAAEVLERVPVVELFREGHARAAELGRRARSLLREGWAAGHAEALELLDSPVRERIEGLLQPRPLYYEIDEDRATGVLRDFRSAAEIDETRVAVEMAEVLGRLLIDRLGLDLARAIEAERDDVAPRRFGTLLTTLLAWHATRSVLRGDALPPEVAADFLRNVASRRTAAPEAPERALAALIDHLGLTHALAPRELAVIRGYGRFCIERLAVECGGLDPGIPLDPRAISCLLVADPSAADTT
jgi:hypothetical protein